jgi:hypothetical protein
MHLLSSHLGASRSFGFSVPLGGRDLFFYGLYHVQTFLASLGYTIFLFVFCFARCYRRFSVYTLLYESDDPFGFLQCLVFSCSCRLMILHSFFLFLFFYFILELKDSFLSFLLSISCTRPKRWKVNKKACRLFFSMARIAISYSNYDIEIRTKMSLTSTILQCSRLIIVMSI